MKTASPSNIHITLTPLIHESRIFKEIYTLRTSKIFSDITIISEGHKGLPTIKQAEKDLKVVRINYPYLIQKKGFIYKLLKIFFFTFKALYYLFKVSTIKTTITCHSLLCLHIGVVLKLTKKVKLVYDAHELESQQDGYSDLIKTILKLWERILIKHVDYTIVVSNLIKEWYQLNHKVNNIVTIRNIPLIDTSIHPNNTSLKEKYNLKAQDILFVYIGNLGTGRFIESLIKIFKDSEENKHLLFIGYGDFEGFIKETVLIYKNIHFHPAVQPDNVISLLSSCDVGLSIIENNGLSYYYCLPNKLFEYTVAGIPSIVSNFPEMTNFITSIQAGWVVEPDLERVKVCIQKVTLEQIHMYKEEVRKHNTNISWKSEEANLITAYTVNAP